MVPKFRLCNRPSTYEIPGRTIYRNPGDQDEACMQASHCLLKDAISKVVYKSDFAIMLLIIPIPHPAIQFTSYVYSEVEGSAETVVNSDTEYGLREGSPLKRT